MIIFLGAGASKPFGIPTMQAFVDEFGKEIETNGSKEEKQLYSNIKRLLKEHYSAIDLEIVLTLLNDMAHGINSNTLGPSFAYYRESTYKHDWSQAIKTGENSYLLPPKIIGKDVGVSRNKIAEKLKDNLKKFIKENCITDNIKKIVEVYDQFFDFLSSIRSIKLSKNTSTSIINKTTQVDGHFVFPINIFTTNYDHCIEIYCKKRGIKFIDGFQGDSFGRMVLNAVQENREFFKQKREFDIGIFKLHGSIDWYKEKNSNEIIKSQILLLNRANLIDGGEIEGEVMIYPTQEKYLFRDPFFEMFHFLKEELKYKHVCLVIGYSFRDEAIKNIFIDAVNQNPKLKIVLLAPSANEIIEKELLQIKSNVVGINGKFDDIGIYEKLKDGIENFIPT